MEKSILNVEVGSFKTYRDTNPKRINLLKFLQSDTHAAEVERLRQFEDKSERDRIKGGLPAITPSGTFARSRKEESLNQHSGLIQFDIDAKDNPDIFASCETIVDFKRVTTHLKAELAKLVEIAYVGVSVSGRGLWGLIPITSPKHHKEHFRAISEDFQALGITIDPAPANVASLRGYSYDPNAYFNHKAKRYERRAFNEPVRRKKTAKGSSVKTELRKVEGIIEMLDRDAADITEGYKNWFAIGCALANVFGEKGRTLFHQISCHYHAYSQSKTDKQFKACLRSRKKEGYQIATFYQIAKQHGYSWKTGLAVLDFQEISS